MSPPNLTFTREMRTSAEVVIRFVPRATDTEVVHHRGHIYLLSDLFLICERMTPDEQALQVMRVQTRGFAILLLRAKFSECPIRLALGW